MRVQPVAPKLRLPRRAWLATLGLVCCHPAITRQAEKSKLLFASGFEGDVSLAPPYSPNNRGAFQDVVGRDSETGYTWPATLWGGKTSIQLLTDGPGGAISNRIESVAGRHGRPTRALNLDVNRMQARGVTQSPLLLMPAGEPPTDFTISEWVRLPSHLAQLLGPGGWMSAFGEWKTAGDFRVITNIVVDRHGTPRFDMKWDTDANGSVARRTFWRETNYRVRVPQGEWMYVEFFTHRGNADGRVWLKVNGQTVFDHTGDNIGVNNAPIDRIFLANSYASRPVDVWVDDIQIWEGQPT
jgi:hypothetical protein